MLCLSGLILSCVAICRHIEYGKVLLVWFWHVPLLLVAGSEMVKVIPSKIKMFDSEFFQTWCYRCIHHDVIWSTFLLI